MKLRDLALGLTPPLLLEAVRRWSGKGLRFTGTPNDWAEAQRLSRGYDAANILERVAQATRTAQLEGRFERDGFLFDEPEYPFAVLTALLRAAAEGGGALDVVDFGGSLGSTYRQCRPFLDRVGALQWHVLEQAAFVAAGRAEFQTSELHFRDTPADVPAPRGAQVILLSSVLQYLEHPERILEQLSRLPATGLIIDRTPMCDGDADILCIQQVPVYIYDASYPCRVLSRQKLERFLAPWWSLRCDYACAEGARATDAGQPFAYRGLMFDRKPATPA